MLKQAYLRTFPVFCMLALVFCSSLLQSLSVEGASLITNEISNRKVVTIAPAEIIKRARTWTSIHVPYSKVAPYYPNPDTGYRRDCSGFVSMAWGIPAGLLPQAPHGLVTEQLYDGSDSVQQPSQLEPGDILLNLDRADGFDHAVIFNGWTDATGHPVTYNAQNPPAYYDGLEENGDKDYYGYAVEHTIPYSYYKDYGASGYLLRRFDPQKAARLGYSIVKPSGEWMPPSPKNGAIITDNTIHLAATAYPTQKSDPAIATVYFTVGINGVWTNVCSPNSPSKSGSVYTCDVSLKQFNVPVGKMQQLQVSFNVVDRAGNVNLAPQGVHTISYVPVGNMAGFNRFVETWYGNARALIISSNGNATYRGRVFVACSIDPRPPCDTINGLIIGGLNSNILFVNVNGNTASGVIVSGTADRGLSGTIIPVGSAITVTLQPDNLGNDTLMQVSDSWLLCSPNVSTSDPAYATACVSGA